MVAAVRGDAVLAQRMEDSSRLHGARVIPMMEDVNREAGVALKDHDALVVALGPGSFTGLRTILSTLKGVSLGTHQPLLGVSTLHALARSPGVTGLVAACLDARKGEMYGAVYRVGATAADDEELVAPVVLPVAAWTELVGHLGPLPYAGDAGRVFSATLGVAMSRSAWDSPVPHARALAQCALPQLASPPLLGAMEPLYVRKSYTELSLGQAKKERQ
jgi:tRNA threonylcarbamoyladenosine biosynthesis protein TsaB